MSPSIKIDRSSLTHRDDAVHLFLVNKEEFSFIEFNLLDAEKQYVVRVRSVDGLRRSVSTHITLLSSSTPT